jgi:hypothetical protein
MSDIVEITVDDLRTALVVAQSYNQLHALVYTVVASRKRAGLNTLSIEDLALRTGQPEALVDLAVRDLVRARLLHWTVIASTRSQSRVTVA